MQDQSRKAPHWVTGSHILAAVVIFAVFLSLLSQATLDGFSIRGPLDSVGYTENPWVLRQGDTVLEDQLVLPEYLELETGQLYSLTTTLTYDGSGDEMPYGFLHLDHVYCRVLLDGEVLFSYMPEDLQRWDRAKSPGFIYKAFPVPRDALGRELEIQLLPPLDTPVSYGLPDLTFGDYASTLHRAVVRDMPHNVVMLFCVLLGVVSILFSTTTLKASNYREGISIGVFSLLFSVYMLTECQLNAYYLGNPYYLYLLNYVPFSLMPVTLMGFMRERLLEKHRRLCTRVVVAGSAIFVAQILLHFFGVLDLREMIPLIHLIYFGEMALVVVLISTMRDRKRRRSLALQLAPVLMGMLLDAVIYWLHLEIGSNDATFTIHGVTIFLIIEMLHVWRSSLAIYLESVRSSVYRKMAFVDELTGAGNRRAFDNEIDLIVRGEKHYRSMIVVSADVNRLKFVG